ncbi:MAG: DUF1203 domain-containing protein, partial [Rhizomicrobium sp.]
MSFHFQGLPFEPFAPLFALSDAELEAKGFRRMVAGEGDTLPCRVSLEDVDPGEELLLINSEHQPAHSPYRAKGPIFISKHGARFDGHEVPPALRTRLLSLRAYDKDGMIVEADAVNGDAVEPVLERLFARGDTAYVHVHYAKRGCFAALVERG